MKVSILIPAFNEIKTIVDVVELVKNVNIDKEIILVDDCSSDGTREILKEKYGTAKDNIKIFYHDKNKGKGAAIRTALSHASGEYIVVQDADMEYSPQDIKKLLALAEETGAGAVYGSRFLDTWKTTSFPHFVVNKTLTVLTNILFGGRLTDMETCYKLVKTDLMRSLDIKAERFEFEPEVTTKLLRRGIDIKEIPVSYRGRGYDEGKKIGWRDGIEAVFTLFRLKFSTKI
ncbi:MAG: glycosyltransferase family 2 protein [Candidatus Aadella gelida]|nr:glycosyltransferase family 2 protein [Candidatus Aadella gelida]